MCTNKHDRYFAAQRIQLTPRAAPVRLVLPIQRWRPARVFALGVAVGAALAWGIGEARADAAAVCEADALAARHFAQARDEGVAEAQALARFDAAARQLGLPARMVAREHAAISEVWQLRHLSPSTLYAFVLHRCLYRHVLS